LLNQCSRIAKREPQRAALSSAPDEPADYCSSPLAKLLVRETSDRVHELLARLPEVQADALRLRFFGGLTFPEIAAAMACSEAGAKNRVKTGLLKMSQWLRRDGPAARETKDISVGDLP
jgi:RNA polymerase sigma factor (sigma-70 family)